MTKTLTVTIDDMEQSAGISISGTKQEDSLNPTVVVSFGSAKVALNTKDLQDALNAVVDFQTPPQKVVLYEDAPVFTS